MAAAPNHWPRGAPPPPLPLSLQEPSKREWLAYDAGRAPAPRRLAFCILQTPPQFLVIEALVDMRAHAGAGAVVGWRTVSAAGRACLRPRLPPWDTYS
jgi:hypothetical protein